MQGFPITVFLATACIHLYLEKLFQCGDYCNTVTYQEKHAQPYA